MVFVVFVFFEVFEFEFEVLVVDGVVVLVVDGVVVLDVVTAVVVLVVLEFVWLAVVLFAGNALSFTVIATAELFAGMLIT